MCLLEICLCRYTEKVLVVGIKFDLDFCFSFSIIQSVWMTHVCTQSPCDLLNYWLLKSSVSIVLLSFPNTKCVMVVEYR